MSSEEQVELYAKRIPIYPRSVKGRFRRLKWGILALAYGVYFLLPWLRWERPVGPDQAVLWDLPGRRFYLFDLVIHPQDIFWLAWLLAIAAFLLFFVTGIAGRVFCGYFCFQTLWTDVFIAIERLVQGERPARIRLAKQPWNGEKIAKLGLTHLLWLAVAFVTGFSFTMYWGNAPDLAVAFFTGQAPFAAYGATFFLMTTTYVMAGLAREQVCTYMCPYSRFQAAMFDKDTLIVSYDEPRGEGTAGRAKITNGLKTREERQAKGVGDCIDCGYCVQVCPAGIDIRNGMQYQCIHCALCIDACDSIMDKMEWPRGLIRYTSEHALEGKKTRLLKFKTIGYGIVLVVLSGMLVWNVASQAPYDASVSQVRQPLYVQLSDGRIRNTYELKANNKTTRELDLVVSIQGLPDAELETGRIEVLAVEPEKSARLLLQVIAPRPDGPGPTQRDFQFVLTPVGRDDVSPIIVDARFHTP